jgi:hypothetical protein
VCPFLLDPPETNKQAEDIASGRNWVARTGAKALLLLYLHMLLYFLCYSKVILQIEHQSFQGECHPADGRNSVGAGGTGVVRVESDIERWTRKINGPCSRRGSPLPLRKWTLSTEPEEISALAAHIKE